MTNENIREKESVTVKVQAKRVQVLGGISLLLMFSIPVLLFIGIIIAMSLNPGMAIGYHNQSWSDGMNSFLNIWICLLFLVFTGSIVTALIAIVPGGKVPDGKAKSGIIMGSVSLTVDIIIFFLIASFLL